MLCPVCKTQELLMTERNGIEIDYCPTCRGVWLDRGELDKIIERTLKSEPYDVHPVTNSPGGQPNWPQHMGHHDEHRRGHHDEHHGGHGQRRSFWKDIFD